MENENKEFENAYDSIPNPYAQQPQQPQQPTENVNPYGNTNPYGDIQQPYGQQPYGQQPYNQQFDPTYLNQMNNMGPTDESGKPIPNNFGMKLTFSILEILSCCLSGMFGMISTILGIVACVFTCQANNAYKEGRYEEFKSKRKTSNILLWTGLGLGIAGFIAAIFFSITMYKDIYRQILNDTTYNNVFDDDDYDFDFDDDDDISGQGALYEGGNYDVDFTGMDTFTADGISITFPMTLQQVIDAGFVLDIDSESILTTTYEADDFVYCYIRTPSDEWLGTLTLVNKSDEAVNGKDLTAIEIWVSDFVDDYEFANGIGHYSTISDVVEQLGEPTEVTDDTYGVKYKWFASDDKAYTSYVQIDYSDDEISGLRYCFEDDLD